MPDETTPPPSAAAASEAAAPPSPPSRLESLTEGLQAPAPRETSPREASPSPPELGAEPSAAPAPAKPPTFKFRGRDYSVEDLVQHGLLADALTTAEQFPHLQKKYQEVLEQARQQPAQPVAPPPQPKPQAQIRAEYAGEVSRAVQQGYIESDFAQLYPDFASQAMMHVSMLYDLAGAMRGLRDKVDSLGGQTTAKDAIAKLNGTLDQVAGKGEPWAWLKDPKERTGFLDYLGTVNPLVEQLTPEFLSQQAVAYKADAFLEATRQTAERQQHQRDDARRKAAGDGRGSRPTATPAPTPTHLDTLLEGLVPARR